MLDPCIVCSTAGLRGSRWGKDRGEEDWAPIWPEVRDCKSEAVAWRLAGRRGAWGAPEAWRLAGRRGAWEAPEAWRLAGRRGGWKPPETWRLGRRGG